MVGICFDEGEWGGVQEKFKDPPTTAWGNPAITPIYKAQ